MRKPTLDEKDTLSPMEAAAFYNLSNRKFYRLLSSEKRLPFVARYRKRKLVIKSELENYLEQNPEKREWLKKGKPHLRQEVQIRRAAEKLLAEHPEKEVLRNGRAPVSQKA